MKTRTMTVDPGWIDVVTPAAKPNVLIFNENRGDGKIVAKILLPDYMVAHLAEQLWKIHTNRMQQISEIKNALEGPK